MSIKTLRKRIALVAVSALGAGLMSVVAAPVANAAAIVADETNITSTAATAVCSVDATQEIAYVPLGSLGVVIGHVAGAATDTSVLTISGPAKFSAISAGTNATAVLTSLTVATLTDIGDGGDTTVTVTPTGVGTVTITIAATAGGAAIDTLTLYVESACSSLTYSSTYSFVETMTASAGNADDNVDDQTSATAGTPLYIKITPKNGYNESITTGGTLTATATNGAVLNLGSVGTIVKGINSQATATSVANASLRVDPASSATTSTTTVTVSLNGVNVATKTLTFFGEQASISVDRVTVGRTSSADTGVVIYTYKDSAGNVVPGDAASFVASSATTRFTTGTSIKAPTSSASTIIGNNDLADNMEYKLGGSTASGVMAFTCGSSAGSGTFTIATTSTVNANTLTANVNAKCAGGLFTYTVSTDKAKYNIGEVATITIDAKDSAGNPVSDNTQLAASSVSVGGGSLTYTLLGTAAAGFLETFTDGKVSLKAQITTEGTFNTVVSLAGGSTASAQAAYSVVNPLTVGAVSNAEVLASIVKLIAAINKQIRALQKSLRR
jgi:hypothetical protein